MTDTEFLSMVPGLRMIALGMSRRLVGDGEAEDMAQDTMLALWTIRDGLLSADHARSCAARTARHRCIDALRRRKACVGDDTVAGHPAPRHAGPDSQLEQKDNDEWLRRRLAALPPNEQIVLRLRQVEMMPTDEIARIVGISSKSVATLLARARHKMLKEITKRMRQ